MWDPPISGIELLSPAFFTTSAKHSFDSILVYVLTIKAMFWLIVGNNKNKENLAVRVLLPESVSSLHY